MRSTKMVDASALLALAKPDVENEARTVDPNVAPENDPSPKGNWNTLEGPQSLQMYGNGEENVMNKKEDDHSDIRIKNLEKEAQSPISKKEEPKEVDHPMIPHKRPHLLHDSSKKCEFHFGRPGHSLEDCHALKNKVQDLVDHGILRINEGSTPSVIIAWPPERRKDETVIPSPQSQGPTTCGIQPVHLTTLPTLSEVGEHTVPKTQPKLMSNFRNLDDQCSSDKEKAEYCTNRCVTLKRKIQELGHSELEVPTMVQARKPSMHTVPMKKARSTLGFRANEAIKRSDRANHFKEHRSLDPASPRMNSQDPDITTTEEEEVHTKRTDPPPAGDINTTHGRQSTREPLRFNHDPTNFPISIKCPNTIPYTGFGRMLSIRKRRPSPSLNLDTGAIFPSWFYQTVGGIQKVPENWKEISHHRHTQQTWRSILRQISRSLKIYIIQANGHLLQNLPNRSKNPKIQQEDEKSREGLTYEIAKPKVWDASALRPSSTQHNRATMGMASKAHKAKSLRNGPHGTIKGVRTATIPTTTTSIWTSAKKNNKAIQESEKSSDLGGHPSQIIPDSRPEWSLRPNHSRFEDLGGHPSQIIPDSRPEWSLRPNHSRFEDLGGHPSQIIPDSRPEWSLRPNHSRFETWVVTQAKSSPIRDLSGHSGRIIPDLKTWVVTQAKSSPIRDLSGHSGRIIPDLKTWVVTQAKSSPTCLDLRIRIRYIILFETWVVTQAKSSPTCLDLRIQTVGWSVWNPNLRLGWSPKPNHP
uniref:Uncharacterized protein n=1 Tax=Fagus sylvatica TaxID=28930 RepID=A0A2N9ILD8_FAGSY